MQFMSYAPIVFVSAETKQRVHKILELVKYVAEQQNVRIATSVLKDILREAVMQNPPPTDKGNEIEIVLYYAIRSETSYICSVCQCAGDAAFSYDRIFGK